MAVTGFLYKKNVYRGKEYWVVQGDLSVNGYVDISDNDKSANNVWVHGGVTYEGYLTELLEDCRVSLTMKEPISKTSVFVYGFDTAHAGEQPMYSDNYKKMVGESPSFKWALESILNGIEWTPELVEDECKAMIDDLLDEK